MRINKAELRVEIDVDSTLVTPKPSVRIVPLWLDYYGMGKKLYPIARHIELLKAYKARGYQVTVHSANGFQWAQNVIKALKLTEYVDVVETKAIKYVDDRPADDWMQRVFIPEGE